MGAEQTEAGKASPGGAEDIEALFHAWEGPLLRYAMRLLRKPDLAQDLVQETFLRLHRHAGAVREPRGWLYRTLHNLAMNHLRDGGRTVSSAESGEFVAVDDPADLRPLPDEQLARWEGIGLVRLGLEALDPRSREVVRLKFQEDLSYKEIAARTGLTSGHVGYLLHHALKALSADLSKAGLTSS